MTNDLDRDLREMFLRHEEDLLGRAEASPPTIAHRVHVRQTRNLLVAGLLAVVLVLGAATGIGALRAADDRRPAQTGPTPPPDPGPALLIPRAGAEASRPASGELIMEFTSQNLPGCDWCRWFLYADGRVLSLDDGPDRIFDGLKAAYVERRLTAEGIELIRQVVLTSPDLESGNGVKSSYHYFWIRLHEGDRTRSVSWNDDGPGTCGGEGCFGFEDDVFTRMSDLESWLPSSAWSDAPTAAFVPSRYVVYLNHERPRAKALPPPADSILRSRACQIVSTADARAVVAAFGEIGIDPATTPR